MQLSFLGCLIFCHYISAGLSGDAVVADSPFGKIQGMRRTDEGSGHSYFAFLGIPYAKPPVGKLRFAKPEPHPKLDGLFDGAQDKEVICPHPSQFSFGETDYIEDEDCLILNILTKDFGQDRQSLKKVLVFIHGGAFLGGTAHFYDTTSFVIREDVIVVTINYRLGILGFLSTENEASPGNYGLWDQTLALKWVKDNIRAFGGDPNDITIAGESAGAASVGYHAISPHGKGLFTRAYLHSGTATSVFARSIDTISLTLQVAKMMGCWNKEIQDKMDVDESKAVIQCMRDLPASSFASFNDFGVSRTLFVPVLDDDFIPDSPQNLLKDDAYLDSIGFFQKTYLFGLNNNEASSCGSFLGFTKAAIFTNNETSADEKESQWNSILTSTTRMIMQSRLGEKGSEDQRILNAVDDFYKKRYADYSTLLVDLLIDLDFLIPPFDYLQAVSRRPSCNAYLMYFDHFPDFMKGPQQRGTAHAADILYFFDIKPSDMDKFTMVGMQGEMSEMDLQMKALYLSVIGNFVKSGDPGRGLKTKWPRFDAENSYYLHLNLKPWVSKFLKKDKQDFWLGFIPQMLTGQHSKHEEL